VGGNLSHQLPNFDLSLEEEGEGEEEEEEERRRLKEAKKKKKKKGKKKEKKRKKPRPTFSYFGKQQRNPIFFFRKYIGYKALEGKQDNELKRKLPSDQRSNEVRKP